MKDKISLISDKNSATLEDENRLITAEKFNHFYLDRSLDPKRRNEFRFKVTSSSKMAIIIGVQEVQVSKNDVKYGQQWRLNLRDGKKFEKSKGKKYLKGKVYEGDVISVVVDCGKLSFSINGKDQG